MKALLKNLFAKKSTKSLVKAWRPSIEGLEERSLLAAGLITTGPIIGLVPTASLSNGVLKIVGTNMNDNLFVKQVNGQISVQGIAGSFSAAAVSKIEVYGLGGDDWIKLDSQSLGGMPITKPALIKGGGGDDLIFGTATADQTLGEAGDDTIYGLNGNDYINGGLNKDTVYGGLNNDFILGDFADAKLSGQGGVDTIVFQKLDPSTLANATPAALKGALQQGLTGKSYSKTKNGLKFSVSNLEVETVSVANGVTTVAIKAKVSLKQYVLGQVVASTSGTLKFTVQPQLSATLIDAAVSSASVNLANVQVTEMNLNNVPNWIDNASEVREFLESKIAAEPPMDYTSQLQAYLAFGYSLGPVIEA